MPFPWNRRRLYAWLLIVGSAAFLFGAAWMIGDLALGTWRSRAAERATATRSVTGASTDCRSCHEDVYQAWAGSHHAHAHRPIDPVADAPAFGTDQRFTLHGVDYEVSWKDGKPSFVERRPGRDPHAFTADFVLGYTPLRQYVVPVGGGRYQLSELAFDPKRRDWFNVFGAENRQPGKWGHWTGRGMNWNSMCAHCHLTGYSKNYDPATDTYATRWREHGIGCIQCHGDLTADHARPGYRTPLALSQRLADRAREQQTCAPCHAVNELLTGAPRPGVNYHDHYRLVLPTDPTVFHPDGQVLNEDFNWTSLLTSRMGGKAGVTCLDCHEPHSGRTRLPVANNALCQQCHGGPNPKNAPIIDPVAHSHHKPDSTGNQCVACHMPTTTYMQRDPRHDHGFLKPDPLLTKELGIPNACDRCHADKGIDWQIEANERWYGEKLNSRQRQRARVVAALQRGSELAGGPGIEVAGGLRSTGIEVAGGLRSTGIEVAGGLRSTGIEVAGGLRSTAIEVAGGLRSAVDALAAMIETEDVPAWKATLLQLAAPHVAAEPKLATLATTALKDTDPLVRAAAVQVLATDPAQAPKLEPLLRDPARLVRLDAAWALSSQLPDDAPARRELDAYLALGADQPAGRLRLGQDLANRGRLADALPHLRKAIEWDPYSPPFYSALGSVLDASGRPAEAAAMLLQGARANPRDAGLPFEAGLAFAAAGNATEAEAALREATRRDPKAHRAWYNLALLLANGPRRAEAVSLLQRAEELAPTVADYPFARATVLLNQGDRSAAAAALQRTLELQPDHPQAAALLRRIR